MVSNGRRPECVDAKEKCPAGCQSWVSTAWWNLCARRLTSGTTSSPHSTGSLPPGQKSFCTSTTSNRSSSPIASRSAMSGAAYHGGHELLDRGCTDLLHHGAGLDAQELEHALHAGLAERAKAPDIRPADAHGGRPHAQRLDDVGAAAEPGIDQDGDAPLHRLDDLRQRVDGGAAGIFAARAVVGD